jgi:hypothetical protein
MIVNSKMPLVSFFRQHYLSDFHLGCPFETSFDSKQPKLEPKLVSALSETKRLFRLFRFYTETASFGVSIESKQKEDQPKQTETNRNESNMKNILTF